MQKRRRFKQTTSFEERLAEFASSERAKADSISIPESMVKYELLKKLKHAETAANIDVWASAGLRPGRPRSGRVHER